MIFDLKKLIKKYNLNIKGVIHCGAHIAEEVPLYRSLGIKKVVWIEGNSELIPRIKKRTYADHKVIEAVLSDKHEQIDFYITNQSQSSSTYDLGNNKTQRKGLNIDHVEKKWTTTLDRIIEQFVLVDCNMINLDIQGGELKALQGCVKNLKNIDYIYSEVHINNTYKNVPQLTDIDDFLKQYNFVMKECSIYKTKGWGEAFWIRTI